jgi:hypothetical protein
MQFLPFSQVTAWRGKPAAGHVTANSSPATAEMGGILRITGSPAEKTDICSKCGIIMATERNIVVSYKYSVQSQQ